MPLFLRLLATPGIGTLLSRLPANRSGTMAFLDAMGQQKAKRAGLISDEFVQWWISLGRDTNTMVNDRDLIRHGLTFQGMRFELIIPEDRLRHLPHPTYVYWGEDDPLAERSYAERLFPFMPKGSIDFIPNSGHLPWLDNPADAAARTRAFLLS
jgi:pimeloyl-ACP methyl ester carboxylesterase